MAETKTAYVPSAHEAKFDRQLRLWGAHGQKSLETAHICVLDSGATASETLKNLVLPNLGEFTLVDDALVTVADTGNNFFVEHSDIGKPRAEAVTRNLLEMNPDVKGNALVRSVDDVINNDIEFFGRFRLIIGCQLTEAQARTLAKFAWEKSIPLFLVRSFGLLASLRFQMPELCITESHPDNDRSDLYLHPQQIKRFPALQAFCDSFAPLLDKDKESASGDERRDHAHVPYAVVLVNMLQKFVKQTGKVPSSFEEGKAFKKFIQAQSWDYGEEENFAQAVEFAHRIYRLPQLDALTQQVIDDPKAAVITRDTPHFWILVRALRDFMAAEGAGNLPVSSAIPDMISEPKHYVALKEIYRAKSAEDVSIMEKHVARILTEAGRPAEEISREQIEYFVTNVRCARVIRTRSLEQEYTADLPVDSIKSDIEEHGYLMEERNASLPEEMHVPTPHNIHWYFALRAAHAFHAAHKRFPGQKGADGKEPDLEADVAELVALQTRLLNHIGLDVPVEKPCLEEITRQAGTEIHNVAAFIGGVASQEALKLLVGQFVPINNTFLHNAMHCSSLTIAL